MFIYSYISSAGVIHECVAGVILKQSFKLTMVDVTEIKTTDYKEYLRNNRILYKYTTNVNSHTLLKKKKSTTVIHTPHIPQNTAQGNKSRVTGQEYVLPHGPAIAWGQFSLLCLNEEDMETIQHTMPPFFSLKPFP